jgi:hypothetical protein
VEEVSPQKPLAATPRPGVPEPASNSSAIRRTR